jgi:hypothetical protein
VNQDGTECKQHQITHLRIGYGVNEIETMQDFAFDCRTEEGNTGSKSGRWTGRRRREKPCEVIAARPRLINRFCYAPGALFKCHDMRSYRRGIEQKRCAFHASGKRCEGVNLESNRVVSVTDAFDQGCSYSSEWIEDARVSSGSIRKIAPQGIDDEISGKPGDPWNPTMNGVPLVLLECRITEDHDILLVFEDERMLYHMFCMHRS